ncbi:hypothetical protein JL722_5388 [Aureococcus anophagefferens]|nr:hypothetical protein JL722_5388 [Aureococcus anophagefferens]
MELWCFFKGAKAAAAVAAIRDLVRRLRAGEPAASLKVPRKPKSAEELFCLDKAEQLACSEDPASVDFELSRGHFLVAGHARRGRRQEGRLRHGSRTTARTTSARFGGLGETDPLRLEFDELARRDVAAAAADELPVDRLQRAPDPGLVNLPTIWPRMRFPVRVATPASATKALSAFRYAQPECGVRYPYGSKLGLFKGRVGGGVRVDVNDMETLRARARRTAASFSNVF